MITRGIIIGKIIDDLSKLQGQINLRCEVGLTDLNKYCEDFIKEVLNICFGIQLKNLNEDRSNEPGLDLGDEKNKIAFQITSTSTSQKVTKTLEAITPQQLEKYEKIRVFIIGKKQSKYDAVDAQLMKDKSFDISDIWDITDLCRQIVSLKYEELYALYKLFEKEFQIVITEIEIPNSEGKYPTSYFDKIEIVPNTVCKNARKFLNDYTDCSLENVIETFKDISKLPRVTRDFLGVILQLGEWTTHGSFRVNFQELKRKLRIPESEIREEIGILINRDFVNEPDEGDDFISVHTADIYGDIFDYAIKNKCITKLIVAMDFTILDKE